MVDPVLKVSDLTKTFGKVKSVDEVSFSIEKGEILGLLGANGAGKTTAINMVLGIITPTAGRVEVFGQDLHTSRVELLRR